MTIVSALCGLMPPSGLGASEYPSFQIFETFFFSSTSAGMQLALFYPC
jgi:hypothetical protein